MKGKRRCSTRRIETEGERKKEDERRRKEEKRKMKEKVQRREIVKRMSVNASRRMKTVGVGEIQRKE